MWLGNFEEFPSLAELEENLPDLYRDFTSGEVPGIRRVAELTMGRSTVAPGHILKKIAN